MLANEESVTMKREIAFLKNGKIYDKKYGK